MKTNFEEKLKKLNANLTVLSEYIDSHSTIKVHCEICNNDFYSTPNSLMTNGGCPICAKTQLYEKTRKKHEVFLEEMKRSNPNIEVLGEYKANKEHIKVKCLRCGHIWDSMPCHLIRGHGCPVCANEKRREAARRRRAK